MKAINYGTVAVACAASVALASFMLFLCSVWLLGSASLVQSLALIGMSMSGSGLIALTECKSPSTLAMLRSSPAAASERDASHRSALAQKRTPNRTGTNCMSLSRDDEMR
jgi:hypothetical protein